MKIELVQGFKKYTINTGYLFIEQIIRMIVSLTVWASVIRYLGPEQFGLFSYMLSFVFIFIVLSDLGLENIVVRDLVREQKNENQILGGAFFLKLSGSLLAILLVFIGVHIFSFDFFTRKLILILSLQIIFLPFNCIDFYFQSRVLSKYIAYSKMLSLLCTSVLCLLFVYLKLPLVYFVFIVVAESATLVIGLIIFYTLRLKRVIIWQIKFDIIKKLIKDSWPLIISGIAISIYMRIDRIMLKTMLDVASVGYYSAATNISEVFYFIPIIVTSSLFPAIIRAKMIDKSLYQNRLISLFSILLWMAVVMAAFISFTSVPLVTMIYGKQYLPAAAVLSLHMWAAIFVFLGIARSKWAINENLQVYIMLYSIIGAIINILLNLLLIPILGIKGAAAATLISQSVVAVFSNLLSKKTKPVFVLQFKSLNFIRVFKGVFLEEANKNS